MISDGLLEKRFCVIQYETAYLLRCLLLEAATAAQIEVTSITGFETAFASSTKCTVGGWGTTSHYFLLQ